MATWPISVNAQERTRRLIDLFLVSVLLDAGAGTKWQYKSKESGRFYRRSEGLAVASLEMFKSGMFSSNPNEPCQVDSAALKKLTIGAVAKGLQVTEQNTIDGLEGRTNLLIRLGDALQNQDIFGADARPGNMLGEEVEKGMWKRYLTIDGRLPSLAPHHSGFICSRRLVTYFLGGLDGWSRTHLARFAYSNRRHSYWRCLAVLEHADGPQKSLWKHRPLSQAHSMALLLVDGPHDQTHACAFRWRGAVDRSA